MRKIVQVCVLALAVMTPVQAHDVWLTNNDNAMVLVYGHVDKLEVFEPHKVKKISAFDMTGNAIETEAKINDNRMELKPSSKAGMITVKYDNGFWTNTTGIEWVNKSKREFDKSIQSSHSLKYNKNLLGWNDSFNKPVGLEFEVVPLVNPFEIAPGQALRLHVLYQGKSLADAAVEVHGNGKEESFKTDSNGEVSVPVADIGKLQYIAAYYREELQNNADADERSYTANLVFNR